MGNAQEDRAEAAQLPEGDVIRILLEQHARIRELFSDVSSAEGEHKGRAFDELRALLAVHETAEELVLRPVTKSSAAEVADARNQEEAEANEVLKELEKMDVSSPDFDEKLASFEKDVNDHAEAEENEEFPRILEIAGEGQRRLMGKAILAAEAIAPTHPHPSTAGKIPAQLVVGPFASIVDRARDAINAAMR